MALVDDSVWCTTTPKRLRATGRDTQSGLKSVGSALDVLECFATDGDLGVSDISRRLGIAKSTAHRLLQTLTTRGLVEQDPDTGRYRLGLHLYELGQLALQRNALRAAALPTLRHVAATTRLTTNFSVADGPDVVFVERLENGDGGEFLTHSGRRLPAHTTSAGQAMAAFNPALFSARVQAGFPPRTTGTIRTETDWTRAVGQTRLRGYAVTHSGSFEGASSIAVPIVIRGESIAAVSVFGPSARIDAEVDRLVPLLRAAARRIERGYRG